MTTTLYIPRTSIEVNTSINGYSVNGELADVVMTAYRGQFGKCEIYSPEYLETLEGYLYKGETAHVFVRVINYAVDAAFINNEKEAASLDYKRALVLTELFANTTGLNLKEQVIDLIKSSPIQPDSKESATLAAVVRTIEELMEAGRITPREVNESSEFVELSELQDELALWGIVEEEPQQESVSAPAPKEPHLGDVVEGLFTSSPNVEFHLDTLFDEVVKVRPSTTKSALRGTVNRLTEKEFLSRTGRGMYQLFKKSRRDLLDLLEGAEDEPVQAVRTNQTSPTADLSALRPNFFEDGMIRDYLALNGMDQATIDRVVIFRSKQRERFMSTVLADPFEEIVISVREKPRYHGRVDVLKKALASILLDQPLILKGEAGSGKSILIETLSCLTNLPLYEVSGSLEANKDTLVGSPDIKERGVLATKDGLMTKAAKIGGILSIDEVNMMRPDITAILHAFADQRKTFYNDVEQKMILCSEHSRFVGAMNEKYKGTKELNEALKSRTAMITLSYMTRADLRKMLEGFDGFTDFQLQELGFDELSPKDIKILTNLAGELQLAARNQVIPVLAASTREIITIAKYSRMLSYPEAISMVVAKFDADERQKIAGVLSGNEDLNELGITAEEILNY